jgi:uncharacterized protein (TIGR03000 family)
MYSLLLMTALSTGSAAPACHWRHHYCDCYAYSHYACWCSGYGYWGGCHGCYGAYSWYSCYGCYGWSGYGYLGPGCYSAWGCSGCYHPSYSVYGVMPVAPTPPAEKRPAPEQQLPPPRETPKGQESTRASLTVELPADARLYVDGQLTRSASSRRQFITPPLNPGQAYYYDLQAEVIRDGQLVRVSRRVIVRPGQAVTTSFLELAGAPPATVRAAGR